MSKGPSRCGYGYGWCTFRCAKAVIIFLRPPLGLQKLQAPLRCLSVISVPATPLDDSPQSAAGFASSGEPAKQNIALHAESLFFVLTSLTVAVTEAARAKFSSNMPVENSKEVRPQPSLRRAHATPTQSRNAVMVPCISASAGMHCIGPLACASTPPAGRQCRLIIVADGVLELDPV